MPDYRRPGDQCIVNGEMTTRQPDSRRYDYASAPTRCPICLCDAAGVPWRGWFMCDMRGDCYALVSTGEVFVPNRVLERV